MQVFHSEKEEEEKTAPVHHDPPAKAAILLESVTDARRVVTMESMFWYPVTELASRFSQKRVQGFSNHTAKC